MGTETGARRTVPDRTADVVALREADRFALRLRLWRRRRGHTQERLADMSGLSVRCIRDLELDRVRMPRRQTAAILADALRLTGSDRESFLALAVPRRPPIVAPGELPPAINDLTGRDDELGGLSARARHAASGQSTGPAVVVLHGLAGVGKTSLAVVAGRGVRSGFPDGQLFVDLRGDTSEPVDAGEGLGRLLRSLGVPDDRIPRGTADRTALYRSLTRDRRLAVVLDNAAGESHVRPLLPTGAGCFVLVTARGPLSGLDAVERLAVGVLAHQAALRMLCAIVGPRAVAEAGAVAELAGLCGHLPLALRVAGNRLASRPSWSVERMVGRLRHRCTRLDGLTAGDRGVRPAFAASYSLISPAGAEVFRRCAVIGHADFGADQASAAAGRGEAATVAALEELVDAGLLLETGERYRFHELVRLFAAERLAREEPSAR